MCTRVDLKAAAKVDLHRHLEGAIRLQTLIDLYREAGAPLPEATAEELSPRAQVLEPMTSLEEVLSRFTVAQGAFLDEAAAERIAYEAVEDLAADNVRLAELRFSPEFLCEPHGLDWDLAMAAIVRGVERASREHDVAIGLIAIASRNYGNDSAERTVAFALRHREHVVAFDLAGDERAYPPSLYRDVVAELDGSGLKLTTHYGESGGPEFPREAIEALGSMRLGHGVRHPLSTTSVSGGCGRPSFRAVAVGDVDGFVVVDAVAHAVPEDLEPAIAQGPQRCMVPLTPSSLRVVELTGPPRAFERAERPPLHGAPEVPVVREPARHHDLGLARATRHGSLARVALQRVRRVELFGMIADLTGDPGGEAVTEARKAQVDLAAGKPFPSPYPLGW